MADIDDENRFVRDLDGMDPEGWSVFMRYVAPRLAETNQRLLAELVCREALKRANRTGLAHRLVSDDIAAVFAELGLRIVVDGTDGK